MPNLLIIGSVWPEPKSSAAGSRMMQLVDVFLQANYNITFATTTSKTDNAFALEELGVTEQQIKLNDSSFDDFILNLKPDVVMFDRFVTEEQFGWRVAENCPNALRILDTEDLHALRKGRQQALKANAIFNETYLFNDVAKREIASIYRCDLSLIISELEMEILKTQFKVPEAILCYLPFLLNPIEADALEKLPKFSNRQHFITIGNFLHEPNYNGALYLKESIWPLIKKELPKAEMHIYGAYASQKVNQLHNEKQGFLIKGFAEDVHEVMQKSRVCLAALRFGAGLKGKLVDAMQNGTPCVMTHIAAEGMFENLEPNGFIEDNPENFAKKAIELYKNEALWNQKQHSGFEVINTRFNKTQFQNNFLEKIKVSIEQLHENRLHNFTGQMLMHHTMQSTKFMSRWIEEKNKN
ncbi:glycosyltransferase [Tamlana sedimentorum]|uniref:Glycosyltransferase n=1 Tax=Neotamlana sedimentorum TaxID=1435349 RepID=A0A0D7W659_9FLAO|nr:glycosyltransferase family 4 protein [Tamlana sedimentorum]KJD33277.1 glycosyltransferase [Tamlana sedimentorum]